MEQSGCVRPEYEADCAFSIKDACTGAGSACMCWDIDVCEPDNAGLFLNTALATSHKTMSLAPAYHAGDEVAFMCAETTSIQGSDFEVRYRTQRKVP